MPAQPAQELEAPVSVPEVPAEGSEERAPLEAPVAPQAQEEPPPQPPDLPTEPDPIVVLETAAPGEPAKVSEEALPAPASKEAPQADSGLPPAHGSAPPEVHELLRRYYQAWSNQEWDVVAGCFWTGATIARVRPPDQGQPPRVMVLPAGDVLKELAEELEANLQGVNGKLEGLAQVQCTENVAYAWCRYEASYGPDNEKVGWRRWDCVTLVAHEGVWKIAAVAQSRSIDQP